MRAVVWEETERAVVYPSGKHGRVVNLGHDPTYLVIALDDGDEVIVPLEDVRVYLTH